MIIDRKQQGKYAMDLKDIFGESKSIEIVESDNGKVLISITRKSRFIRKDAEKLAERCRSVGANPAEIILKIDAPLCSKAKIVLKEEGFDI